MNRPEAILLLLASDPRGPRTPLVGTTRLQKLVFLAEKEAKVHPEEGTFGYEAYMYGPVSRQLYDDLGFLVNIGHLERSDESPVDPRAYRLEEIEALQASDFLSDEARYERPEDEEGAEEGEGDRTPTASSDSVVYRLTERGVAFLEEEGSLSEPEREAMRRIVAKYGRRSLPELLRYVYSQYPEFATESDIRDKVL